MNFLNNEKGFVALISVLIVGAIGLTITVSLISLGIGTSSAVFSFQQANEAMFFADSCIEEALWEIRDKKTNSGSGGIIFDNGNCSYNIESTGGEGRIVKAEGESGFVKRKGKVIITSINPKILVASWQEVSDY